MGRSRLAALVVPVATAAAAAAAADGSSAGAAWGTAKGGASMAGSKEEGVPSVVASEERSTPRLGVEGAVASAAEAALLDEDEGLVFVTSSDEDDEE